MNWTKTSTLPQRHRAKTGAFGYVVPIAFVLCWSSGFVVPRAFRPYSEPLIFVTLRNAGAFAVLALIALVLRAPWPRTWADYFGLAWSGALLQGFSLALVYWAVSHGLPVGVAALIGGLQPVITAMLAVTMLGETLSRVQWSGIIMGFAGVALVVSPKIAVSFSFAAIGLEALCLAGVASLAYGSIYQKRFEGTGDAWTRTAVMFAGALLPPLTGALLLEHGRIIWATPLTAVYVWSVLALAIGATMALLFLIQRGEAARASAFIYLVPPVSAVMAYIGFGEPITAIQLAGFIITAVGVALTRSKSEV
jgi:drug/metabolite transporter (DMT)-like permease